jgi:BolA protein
MSIQNRIEQKLAGEFDAEYLQVENESHMHNVAPGSESHFKVTIVSDSFKDQMLIKRSKYTRWPCIP